MAAHPELDRKTTILLSTQLHDRLTQLAARRGTSMGALIREAVEAQYGLGDGGNRMDALRALSALNLPVGSPAEMKAECVEQVEDLQEDSRRCQPLAVNTNPPNNLEVLTASGWHFSWNFLRAAQRIARYALRLTCGTGLARTLIHEFGHHRIGKRGHWEWAQCMDQAAYGWLCQMKGRLGLPYDETRRCQPLAVRQGGASH